MSHSVVVIAQTESDRWEVDAFDGVPVVVPVTIVLAAGVDDMTGAVVTIRQEILTRLAGATPDVVRHSLAPIPSRDPQSSPYATPGARSTILAILCSSQSPTEDRVWYQPWATPSIRCSALPIFAAGANPSILLGTEDLRKLNASFWKTSPSECIPAIFGRVGLTSSDQRVFVSYRRLETQPLAEQLFDALSHDGFDVFVDRFSVSPGVDFQLRLDQELADKSMVVLLESQKIEVSGWTRHEIETTIEHRLGFMALTLPDRTARPLDGPHQREKLSEKQFVLGKATEVKDPVTGDSVDQWGRLTDDALAHIVATIKSVHDAAMFRRRDYIETVMRDALRVAGVQNVTRGADGLIRVQSQGKAYIIWLTTRPPGLPDFHTTHPRTKNPKSTGVIIGPTGMLEMLRLDQLAWLGEVSSVVVIDEDDITEAARQISEGKL